MRRSKVKAENDDALTSGSIRHTRQNIAQDAPSNKKRKKVHVMSGQSDAERRILREAQRKLQKTIINSELGDGIENPESKAFETIRDHNNELWNDVKYTREAVLDGENIDLMAQRAARQVDKLVQVPRYDAGRFVQKIRTKCSIQGTFSWLQLSKEVGACYNAVPSGVSFLNGPVDEVYLPKERVVRQRRIRSQSDDEAEEEEPEEIKQQEKDADKLSAVELHLRTISSTLKKSSKKQSNRCREIKREVEGDGKYSKDEKTDLLKKLDDSHENISAIKCLFNPQSFTQTVENIFHFSFMVKNGSAGIKVERNPFVRQGGGSKTPTIRPIPRDCDNPPQPRQAIIAFNMADWRSLCAAYKIDKSDVPHRTGSKHTKKGRNSVAPLPH
mmetsp:Transcript_20031/g.23067  ORF Transcript_20031/g.23067 Transcript_20031/m.23067 type:complete len:386 (-) Transcript_20031:486-1643(-)|eukprot:CAMPEP_0194362316 /NCGR_PEP_ID=MMETSP0174-20130528/10054_1 /TAXON_ID=216777 /ORGANISM="Proboscia alata, Strain PI-D3" /LENGTH=385 /DNA_ID=CAMNT_0039135103 /DNA_START=82 /DNA_END=1239 /DNA_ORIENTATION=+